MEAVPAHKKFAIIQEMAGCHGSIQQLCEIAGVSRSGYYKWVKRQERPSQKQLEDEHLKKKIEECHEELKGIYGYRRVKVWLKRKYKLSINHKRVQRLMREKDAVHKYIRFYNHERFQKKLNNLSPYEYRTQAA